MQSSSTGHRKSIMSFHMLSGNTIFNYTDIYLEMKLMPKPPVTNILVELIGFAIFYQLVLCLKK